MNDIIISQIRTFVPIAVGVILSWLASKGIHPSVSQADMAAGIAALTGFFTAVYYTIIRLFEKYVSPKFGWLLGYAQKPSYAPMATRPVTPAVVNPTTVTTPPAGA